VEANEFRFYQLWIILWNF